MDNTKIQTYENLTVDRDKHIAVVTFNRPEKANALDHAHLTDIEAVALSFRDDADVRVVIFTGAGTHFSSGADLSPKPDPQSENSGGPRVRRQPDGVVESRETPALDALHKLHRHPPSESRKHVGDARAHG